MQQVLTIKITPEEIALLDWLRAKLGTANRSDTLRSVSYFAGRTWGAPVDLLGQVAASRGEHPPRRRGSQVLSTLDTQDEPLTVEEPY